MAIYTKQEFYKIVEKILKNPEFKRRKTFQHHGEETVYDHSLKVAYLAYSLAKRFHLDAQSCAIGGLLHDFYSTPWTGPGAVKNKKITQMHGFTHPKDAYRNAKREFPELMTPKIRDIIVKHMFPLTPLPPSYGESWLVTLADKMVSVSVFKNPKDLPSYVGIKVKKKEKK